MCSILGYIYANNRYFYVTIDGLHALVHSLTKSEKRYCRLLMGAESPGKGFIRLLDCLLAYETMGDALTTALTQQFPGATLEPARKHLYRVVMQSLRQFEGTKRIDVRIGQLLHDSQILRERGLVSFSDEQLTKAAQLASQHERGLQAVRVARQQAEQWVKSQFDGIDASKLAAHHALIRQVMDQTQAAIQQAALYETLLLRYRTHGTVSSPKDILRLNDLLLEEYQLLNRQKENRTTGRSFARQQQHLHFQSAYFRMIGDGAGSLRVYRELDALYEQNPVLWAEQPMYYVQLLDGILADLRSLGRYDEMPYFINRLRTVVGLATGLRPTVLYMALYYALLTAVDQQQYADATTRLRTDPVSADAANFERGLAQLALPSRAEFELLLVRLDMGLDQLPAGLHRLNRVLARPVRSLPRMRYVQSRLLHLLLHARLENADYLTYAIRSVERKLTAQGGLSGATLLALNLLRQWLNGRLTINALAQIAAFSGSPADQGLLRDLDLSDWVRAMLGRKAR